MKFYKSASNDLAFQVSRCKGTQMTDLLANIKILIVATRLFHGQSESSYKKIPPTLLKQPGEV